MASQAWFEVHGLHETSNARPNVTPPPPQIRQYAMQESEIRSFHSYTERDWRTEKFSVQATLTFSNGNTLHVQESYDDLSILVSLKTRENPGADPGNQGSPR